MTIPKHLRFKQRIVYFFTFIFLANTLFPGGFATAQILFARPGPGVSRLPLEVAAFNAPGFGTVQDAINLASGNVYVSLDSMARNNLSDTNADDSIGEGQWQLLPRMRLVGFSESFGRDIPLMTPLFSGGSYAPIFVNPTPGSITLNQGDGTNLTFDRLTTLPSGQPSWIERYRADLNGTARVYQLRTETGVQYAQDWIVLVQGVGGGVAHYYTRDGMRYTFYADGEYVDYSQDLHQQYRSAAAGDPDGTTSDYKTEFSYADQSLDPAQEGRITKIKDEYGRVTTYEWNYSNETLTAIYYLLRNENDNSTFARRATFTYSNFSGQRVVNTVTYTAPDGVGNMASRWIDFDHILENGRLLVHKIKRQVLGSGDGVTTTYAYHSDGHIYSVSQTGQPLTTYTYSTNGVVMTQGDKQTTFTFSGDKLVSRSIRDWNPDDTSNANPDGTDVNRTWSYTYYDSGANKGSTKKVTTPSGKTTDYAYDTRGNITSIIVSGAGQSRTQTFTYDADNRLTNDIVEGQSINVDGMTRAYKDQRWKYEYTNYTSGNYKATNTVTRSLWDGNQGSYNFKYEFIDTYNPNGTLKETVRHWSGQTQTTKYLYHTGTNWQALKPLKNNQSNDGFIDWANKLPAAKQYADLPKSIQIVGLGKTEYWYDGLENVAKEKSTNSFVGDFNGSNAPLYGDTDVHRSYNGFGQTVWTYQRQRDAGGTTWRTLSRNINIYYPTGELNYSWTGRPENVTDYQYNTSGSHKGRIYRIKSGIDDDMNGTVDTQRNLVQHVYDSYGRVSTKFVDGHEFTYAYDTLDRVVRETRPPEGGSGSRGYTRYRYDKTGELYGEGIGGVGWTIMTHDALGRTTTVKDPDGNTVETTYDPYDRPVKVVDNRLTMNSSSNNHRASYFVYDSFGNLTKQLGAVMVSAQGDVYKDERRPYTEYTYDVLGRQKKVRQMVNGSNTAHPNSIDMPSGAEIAETETFYDAYDRPTRVDDPLEYWTKMDYDASGNVYKLERQVWKTTNSPAYGGFSSVTTRTAYDAAGRVTKTIDPRGNTFRKTYDAAGQVIGEYQPDQNGTEIKRFEYNYTKDYLLWRVREPSLTASGTVVTKQYSYLNRKFPSSMREANQNTLASSTSAPLTTYTYDWAGRTLTTTLPAVNNVAATISQTYDTRGNLLTLKDAEGFKTIYTYDKFNRVESEHKPKRTGNANDLAAFPDTTVDGLKTEYRYDAAGNLTREKRNGLYTHYVYNSSGKVIAETKPHDNNLSFDSGDADKTKLTLYRLDGAITGTTTYDYNPDGTGLRDANTSTISAVHAQSSSIPSINSGNVTAYTLTVRGDIEQERSWAPGKLEEISKTNNYNGLSQRYYRKSNGHSTIYEASDKANGASSGRNDRYDYWKHDQNGNLTATWFEVYGDATKQNYFTYAYTPNNKEKNQTFDVRVSVKDWTTAMSTTLDDGVYLAGSKGLVATTYNNRDLIVSSNVIDEGPPKFSDGQTVDYYDLADRDLKTTKTTHSVFTYWNDGRKKKVSTGNTSASLTENQQYWYDKRGRLSRNFDSSTELSTSGATTFTSYSGDGHTKQTLCSGNVSTKCADTSALYISESETTIGGLVYTTTITESGAVLTEKDVAWRNGGQDRSRSGKTTTSVVYNTKGLPSVEVYRTEVLESGRRYHGGASCNVSPYYEDFSLTYYTELTSTHAYGHDLLASTTRKGKTGDYGTKDSTNCANPGQPNTISRHYTIPEQVVVTNTYKAGTMTLKTEKFDPIPYTAYGQSTKLATNGYDTSTTITYTTDSRGNRVEVAGGKFNGYSKRYDADNRVARFYDYGNAGYRDWVTNHYTLFRYDPYGNSVLAVEAGVGYDSDDIGRDEFAVARNHYSTVTVQSDVQVIQLREGIISLSDDPVFNIINFQVVDVDGYEDTGKPVNNKWNDDEKLKREDFSLADGAITTDSWEIHDLIAFSVNETEASLDAPTESLSDKLGVLPSDVAPPSSGLPDVGTGDVTPPTDTGETTGEVAPPATEEEGEAGGETVDSETPANGLTTFDLTSPLLGVTNAGGVGAPSSDGETAQPGETTEGGLADLSALPDLSAPSEAGGTHETGEPTELAAPGSALPESLSTTNALDIVSPEDTGGAPPVGDATEVTAPSSPGAPDVGTAPSGGPLEVVPPAEIDRPNVPPIGDSTPDPVGEVVPPVGWGPKKNDSVEAQDVWRSGCGWFWEEGQQACVDEQNAKNLQERNNQTKAEIDNILGDNPDSDARKALQDLADSILDIEDAMERQRIRELALNIAKLASESPGEGIIYSRIVEAMVHDGAFSAQSKNFGSTTAIYQRLLSSDLDNNSTDNIRNALNATIIDHANDPAGKQTLNLLKAMDFILLASSFGIGLIPGTGVGEATSGQFCAVGRDGLVCEKSPKWARTIAAATDVPLAKLIDIPVAGAAAALRTLKISIKSLDNANLSPAYRLLKQQLAEEELISAILRSDGEISPEILSSPDLKRIIDGDDLNNLNVTNALTSDGSNISDWGKYSFIVKTNHSSGDFHFYYNPVTGKVNYSQDFKVKDVKINIGK